MADFLQNKMVTTRKEHRCFGCARQFPNGSQLKYTVSVDSGDFLASYWCPVCVEYMQRHMHHAEEIGMGDLNESGGDWEALKQTPEGESDEL